MTKENDQYEIHRQERDFLLQGAVWQDSLLQSYRTLHTALQAILLAIGIGVFAAFLSAEAPPFIDCLDKGLAPSIYFILLLLFFISHLIISSKMRKIVIARGRDVDYWHRAIIKIERNIPAEFRHFSKFKIEQTMKRAKNGGNFNFKVIAENQKNFLSDTIGGPEYTDDFVDNILGKGRGHTRKVVDEQIFCGITFFWSVLVFMALIALKIAIEVS
ncbi:MAG: hypothetical protein QMD09_11675 [Desulfatibacillaceae bacterium]|nr:hypothetical protein [Desulfatibacillaceae bacterium]